MKKFSERLIGRLIILAFFFGVTTQIEAQSDSGYTGIKPYSANPWYWEYKGEPVFLIGASDDDNLFQWTGETLTDHLDLLASVGGNFLRNTISDREPGNVFAFKKMRNGKYDLTQWNEEYWNRLTFFLDETLKRGIFVQLTLWDHFDISAGFRYDRHPWKPENNVNLSAGTFTNGRDFYLTVNSDNEEGLKYQKQFVDKLLSVTMEYDHIIYNLNNESDESPEWELFWANYLKETGGKAGKKLYVTTLQFDPANAVRFAMTYPDLFSYVEISQNNQDSRGGRGPGHWDNLMYFRSMIADFAYGPMPMVNEKVYGGKEGLNQSAGTGTEAINRIWRNLFAGCAASRLHRPAGDVAPWGSGLNKTVQTHIKSMNMLLEELDIFSCAPNNNLLVSRVNVPSVMEAYVSANIGSQYAVFFPQGRYTVAIDPWVYVKKVQLRWLDIDNNKWSEPEIIEVNWEGGHYDWGYRGRINLETPANRPYVALIDVLE